MSIAGLGKLLGKKLKSVPYIEKQFYCIVIVIGTIWYVTYTDTEGFHKEQK